MPPGWKAAGILPGAPVCEGHPLPDGREARPGDPVSPGEVIQHHHRYVVAPPSVHPSGRRYRWLGGNPLPVNDLPSPGAAMSWLEALSESKPVSQPAAGGNGSGLAAGQGRHEGRAGDDFNESADWTDILLPLGAVLHHEAADGERYWTRPGKDRRDGYSATTGYADDADRLMVFTSSWPPFADGEVYDKFGAYRAAEPWRGPQGCGLGAGPAGIRASRRPI